MSLLVEAKGDAGGTVLKSLLSRLEDFGEGDVASLVVSAGTGTSAAAALDWLPPKVVLIGENVLCMAFATCDIGRAVSGSLVCSSA